jgi:hypothetical protein
MEDKLFYFPPTQGDVLWKDIKNSTQNETQEWSFKKDSSGNRTGTLNLNKIHKLYVTLIGGGGSGSLGEKRPQNSTMEYARNHTSYNEYTNSCPLPGCGGGGGATLFRIPIILIQSHQTVIDYTVGKGGEGMIDTKDEPMKTATQRVGKSGEATSLLIKQMNTQNSIVKTIKIKAVGGGGGGVVGHTYSRSQIYNMKSTDVEYVWDWSFGYEYQIESASAVDIPQAKYDDTYYQYWYIRHADDPIDPAYNESTHFARIGENWTQVFKRASYAHVAFHRELDFPIGSDKRVDSAENRNEYIPYNLLTHGQNGISRLEWLKPYDKILLKDIDPNERYFGGDYASVRPSDSGLYKTYMDNNGVSGSRRFDDTSLDPLTYNFLWQYAPEQHYVDDRSWVQIWQYNVDDLRNHPRYYFRTGDIFFCKDRTVIYPEESSLPMLDPYREKITLYASGKQDIVLDKWSREFTALMKDYGGPVKKIPQPKGSIGAFGGAGAGFLHYDDPVPQNLHGLYGGREMRNVWKIPESGRGGNPYPKQIWNTIDVQTLDASGLGGAYYYWGGEGYEDADSRGGSAKMTTFFIPGSGGGALDYVHQNHRISRRKYTDKKVDFADILPAMSESPFTNVDNRIMKWFAENYESLATGGKITYQGRDPSNNQIISRLYMNDLYGTHKINFTNKGETGPRPVEELLMIYGAGGGGGKAFYYTPGNGQENPDMEPKPPEYGCGSGGSCSLNIDGAAVITGLPTGSVDYYLRKMIEYDENELYIDFHNDAYHRINGALAGVLIAIMILNIIITIVTDVLLPGLGSSIKAAAAAAQVAIDNIETAGKTAVQIAKLTKEATTRFQRISMKLMKVANKLQSISAKISSKLRSIRQHIEAFFSYVIEYSGKSFAKNLDAIKKADDIAAAVKKANKLAEGKKLLELAEKGQRWKIHLKRIPSYLFSLVTGDIGEIFVKSFDTIAIKTTKNGVRVGKIQNRLFMKLFGKYVRAAKYIANSSKVGKGIKGIADIADTAEDATDIGRKTENLSNLDSVTKNAETLKSVDQKKSLNKMVTESVDKQKVEKARTQMRDKLQESLLDKSGKSEYYDPRTDLDALRNLNDAEKNELMQGLFFDLDNTLSGKRTRDFNVKLDFDNPVDTDTTFKFTVDNSNRDTLKQLHKEIGSESSELQQKMLRKNNLMKASDNVDSSVLASSRVDPEVLDESFKTMTMKERGDFVNYMNGKINDIDPTSRIGLNDLKTLLEDPGKTISYRVLPLGGDSGTIQLMQKVQDKVDDAVELTGSIGVTPELQNILNGFPGLKNSVKNSGPAVKKIPLKAKFKDGENMVNFMNKNPSALDEFTSLMDENYFTKKPPSSSPTNAFDENSMNQLLNRLSQNQKFKDMMLKDPNKIDELGKLVNMTPEQASNVRANIFSKLSNDPKQVPGLIKAMKTEDLDAMKGLVDGDKIDKSFYQNVDNYLNSRDGKFSGRVEQSIVDGKKVYTLDGKDITAKMDKMTDAKKSFLQSKIRNPNQMLDKDLVPNDFDPNIRLNEKSLSLDSKQKLNKVGIDVDSANYQNKFDNLYDDVTNNELATTISNKINGLNKADPNYQNQVDELNSVLNELKTYRDAPRDTKMAVRNPNPPPRLDVKESNFERYGMNNVSQNDIDRVVDENGVNRQIFDDTSKKVDDEFTKTQKEIDDANKLLEQKKKEYADAQKSNIDARAEAERRKIQNSKAQQEYDEAKARYDDAKAKKEVHDRQVEDRNKIIQENQEEVNSIEAIAKENGFELAYTNNIDANGNKIVEETEIEVPGNLTEIVVGGKKRIFRGAPIKKRMVHIKVPEQTKGPLIKADPTTIEGKKTILNFLNNRPKDGKKLQFSARNDLLRYLSTTYNPKDVPKIPEFPAELAGILNNDPPKLKLDVPVENEIPLESFQNELTTLQSNLNRLNEKRLFLDSTRGKLAKLNEYRPARTFKQTPPPVDPISTADVKLSLDPKGIDDPIIEPETIELEIVEPKDNYEYLFQLLSKGDRTTPPKTIKPPAVKDIPSQIPSKTNVSIWISKISGVLRLPYHIIYGLNRIFNTKEFSKYKAIKYRDASDNEKEINSEIMLNQFVNPENFIHTCVTDILDKKPTTDISTRLSVYEYIFNELFDYPSAVQKSQIDNEMIALLMEQRRRGIAIDVEYIRNFVNYENLNIYHKLNYDYLMNDFTKVQQLLFSQINMIKNNHMIFV